jgi:hypothetical protein
VRAAATRQIHDQSLLKRIAQTDPDWSVRLAALQRVYEQKVVEELAKTDLSPFVRQAATRVVANEDILKSLARREEPPLAQADPVSDSWVITGRLLREDGSPLSRQRSFWSVWRNTATFRKIAATVLKHHRLKPHQWQFSTRVEKDKLTPRQTLTLAIRREDQLAQLLRNGTPVKL